MKESSTEKHKRRIKMQMKVPVAMQVDCLEGTDANVLALSRSYDNRSNAGRAAIMQWVRQQLGAASFSLLLEEARADRYKEMPVKASGFIQPIGDEE